MNNKGMITLGLLALASILFSSTVGAQNGNSAKIRSIVGVTGPLNAPLPPKRPFTFNVRVQYSLGSADVAVLHVNVEEYQGPATGVNGCQGSVHMTNGGSNTRITGGSRDVDVNVTWNGDKPVYGVRSQFVGLFVTFSDPKTDKVIFTTAPPLSTECFASGYTL
jgi:hypothetical protein